MSNKQYNTNQIEPGTKIFVQGKTTFSRISKLMSTEELEKDNARRSAKGWQPHTKPFTSISIEDAKVISQPGQTSPTIGDLYIQERFYVSQSGKSQGKYCYTGENKGEFLPRVFERTQSVIREVKLENELANGLDVTLVLNCYKTNMNNGISLEAVIVEEPIQYYQGGSNAIVNAISELFGQPVETLKPDVATIETNDIPEYATTNTQVPAPDVATPPTQIPYPQPQPMSQPQPQIQPQSAVPPTTGNLVNNQINPTGVGGIKVTNSVMS